MMERPLANMFLRSYNVLPLTRAVHHTAGARRNNDMRNAEANGTRRVQRLS